MSTIEINKYVGAVLMALLIMLGLSFIVELTTTPHGDDGDPVYTVDAPDTEPSPEPGEGDGAVSLVALLAEADAAKGENAFKQCTACHSAEQGGAHKIGPNLWGVVGALKARHDDYSYSGALSDLGGWWTYGALDAYLADPGDYAPGNKMAFVGIKQPAKRAAMLAYLRSLSDEPVPLPTSEIEAQEGATQSTIEKMAREGRAAADATVEMAEEVAEATAEIAEETAAAASDMAEDAMESAEQMADAAAEKTDEMAEAASEMAADATEAAAEMAEDASEMAADATAAVGAAVSDLIDRIANADLSAGENVFKKCKACHTPDEGGKHKIGPNLWEIVGAPKARSEDFKYSASFTELGGNWDYDALDAFIAKPADYAKGTKMAFPGIKDEGERAEVIAYLRSLSASPAPLP